MLDGENIALDHIHLYSIRDILGNGISFAASKFYESRAYCRDLHRVGPREEKGLLAGAGQVHRSPELVARTGGLSWWPNLVARIGGKNQFRIGGWWLEPILATSCI